MSTKIEWVQGADGARGESWNPIRARNLQTGKVGHFCIHASPGCANCYAERLQVRFQNPVRYAAQDQAKVELFIDEKTLTQPLRWRRPRTIFVCSMTDLFGEFVPEEWIDRIMAVMAMAPQHRFQVLSKRANRMHEYMTSIENGEDRLRDDPGHGGGWRGVLIEGMAQRIWADRNPDGGDPSMWLAVHLPLPNVWLMVSAEDQERADERIPWLLKTPAAVRGVSLEPLLGPISLRSFIGTQGYPSLDWAIVGGESGPNARPMHPGWVAGLKSQCFKAGVPFFFKQWGEWHHNVEHAGGKLVKAREVRYPSGPPWGLLWMYRVGKKAAGRKLDGRTWDEMPK